MYLCLIFPIKGASVLKILSFLLQPGYASALYTSKWAETPNDKSSNNPISIVGYPHVETSCMYQSREATLIAIKCPFLHSLASVDSL